MYFNYYGYENTDTYNNYSLDVPEWELSNRDKRILDCACWIVDYKTSIRGCSKEFGISKSQLHRDIHNRLRKISYELYQCVKRQLKNNTDY